MPEDDVKLQKLMILAHEHGVKSVKESGGLLTPFVFTELRDKMKLHRFVTENLLEGLKKAGEFVSKLGLKADRYAPAYDGFVVLEGTKYNAIIIEGGDHSNKGSFAVAQAYKKMTGKKIEVFGTPVSLGQAKNLLK